MNALTCFLSFEKRTESPDPDLEPFPTYEESEPEEWYPADPSSKDPSTSLLPSSPEPCPEPQTSRDPFPGAASSACVDFPNFPNFEVPSLHTPTQFPVEEQGRPQTPLRKTRVEASKSFGQEYRSYGRKSSRDNKAHKRSATRYYFPADSENPVPPPPSFPLPHVTHSTLTSAQPRQSSCPNCQPADLSSAAAPLTSTPFAQPRKNSGVRGLPTGLPPSSPPFASAPVDQPRKSSYPRGQHTDLAAFSPSRASTPFQPRKSSFPSGQQTGFSATSTPFSSNPFEQQSRSRKPSAREEYPSSELAAASPPNLLPRSRRATERAPEAAPVSETNTSGRRPTRERRPTLNPSVTPPYPPFSFETGSKRRRYDALNFVPFGLDDNSDTDSPTSYRTPDYTGDRSRGKSEGSNSRPSFRKNSSSNGDPTSSEKKKHKGKKSGSSGLASSIRKFFHSSKRSSKGENGESTAALVSSSDAPHQREVGQTERGPFTSQRTPPARRAYTQPRPPLPDFSFPARPQPPAFAPEAVPGIQRTPFSPESSSPITSLPTSSFPASAQAVSDTRFRTILPENSSQLGTRPFPELSSLEIGRAHV